MNDLGSKVSNPKSGQKVFWGTFKKLLNNKKVTNIPPLLENGSYIADFGGKAEIFNDYFALQCKPLDNGSVLPPFQPLTNNILSKPALV